MNFRRFPWNFRLRLNLQIWLIFLITERTKNEVKDLRLQVTTSSNFWTIRYFLIIKLNRHYYINYSQIWSRFLRLRSLFIRNSGWKNSAVQTYFLFELSSKEFNQYELSYFLKMMKSSIWFLKLNWVKQKNAAVTQERT